MAWHEASIQKQNPYDVFDHVTCGRSHFKDQYIDGSNIKMYLKETDFKTVNWIKPALNRTKW